MGRVVSSPGLKTFTFEIISQILYFRKMADQKLCTKNKFGYCKFNKNCYFRHVNERCLVNSCDVKNCESRHPKACWWYIQYGRCKFTCCAYLHSQKEPNIDFRTKIEELERKIEVKDKEIEIQMEKIKEIETSVREHDLVKRIKKLEQFVLILQEKVETKEKEEHYEARWNPTTSGWTCLDPLVKRDSLEFKCEECDYVRRNSARLKLHMEVKHMNICTLCNYECRFDTRDELIEHTSMVHENLDQVLTQGQFENLSESDLTTLRRNDTPRSRDVIKKYNLRQKKLTFK